MNSGASSDQAKSEISEEPTEAKKSVTKEDSKTVEKWADVKRFLRNEYNVSEEDDKLLAFDFNLDNGRSQRVLVNLAQTEDGEQWINIYSCIGLIDNSELNEVLELLDGNCWGGLIKSGDKHFVRHSLLLETASNSTLIYPISTIAQLADEIEEKYTGGDQY